MSLPFSAEALLQAVSGVAYAVDHDGMILGVSRGPFMPEGGIPALRPRDRGLAIGKNLFEIVKGEPVRQAYLQLHRAVWTGPPDGIGFTYRCDGPATERHMWMSLSRIAEDTGTVAILYQSIIIRELSRPPLPLFAFERQDAAGVVPAGRMVTLCAYCQRVAWPQRTGPGEQEWIEAVEFYQRGGRTDAVVSHGLCEACIERVIAPVAKS